MSRDLELLSFLGCSFLKTDPLSFVFFSFSFAVRFTCRVRF